MTDDDTESASGTAAGAEEAEGAGGDHRTSTSAAKPRHKRTRTGCLKCRIRRRKCDEGKPRCQRCIHGNFECQYGPRLTFLNKNALTVSPSSRAPEAAATAAAAAATTPKYSRLQFVGAGTAKRGAKEASPLTSPAQKPNSIAIANDSPPRPTTAQTPTIFTFQAQPQPSEPPTPKPHPIEPSIAPRHPPPPAQWRTPSLGHESLSSPVRNLDITGKLNGTRPNNDAAYETALDVLLSLGSEGTTGLGHSPEHGSGTYSISADGIGLSPRDLMSVSPNSVMRDRRESSVARIPTSSSISQDRLLQLLRHFRYQVAPWLDLCDMGQTFGLYVPRLAIESEGVLHALLAVAAISQQADSRTTSDDANYLKSVADAMPTKQIGIQTIDDGDLAHLTLSIACRFIADIPNGWNELLPITTIDDDFWAIALAEASQKTISILSVLIRLELAAALVTGSPIRVPEQLHHNQPMSQRWNASSPVAETMFQSTIEPLLLCAKVVNFCAGSFPPPQTPDLGVPLTPVHRWTMLNDALGAWYTNRAQEFRPMVEMDGGGDDDDGNLFPIILFTNGAAVLANQLYHTAMLLLLQSKPRTLRAAGAAAAAGKKSSSMSPLWHAQRVCGIALNNDRRDSWDLCLVASLYLAAQRMTYEPQQTAILECLDRVKTLTGWNVDGFSARVREDWGINVDFV